MEDAKAAIYCFSDEDRKAIMDEISEYSPEEISMEADPFNATIWIKSDIKRLPCRVGDLIAGIAIDNGGDYELF